MPLTLQDIQAEKQRRALLYQIQGEKQRRMAAGRVQSPGVVAPTNPPPPSNYPPPAVAQSSMVSPDYAKVDTGFGPKYVEPIARGITNAATTIPFTHIGRLGDKVYGPRQPFQSEGAEIAGEFAGSALPYNYAAKGMQYIGQGIKGIRGLYTATKLAGNATTGQKAAHLGIEASKAAGRGALFGGVGEGLGQAADAAGRAVSGNEGSTDYTTPIKEAGFFAGIDAAMTLLPPALRGAGMAIRKHLKAGNVAAAEQIVNRIPDSEASQKIKGLFENWKLEYSKGSAVPGEGAPEPMIQRPDVKPPVKMIDNAPEVTPAPKELSPADFGVSKKKAANTITMDEFTRIRNHVDKMKPGDESYFVPSIGGDARLRKMGLEPIEGEVNRYRKPASPPVFPAKQPPRNSYEKKLDERRATYAEQAKGASTEKLTETLNGIGDTKSHPVDGIDRMKREAIESELARRNQAAKQPTVKEPLDMAGDEYVYHNSAPRHLESIRDEGLSLKYAGEYPHGDKYREMGIPDEKLRIYFGESPSKIKDFGGSALLRVKKAAIKDNAMSVDMGLRGKETWYFGDRVAPGNIEIKTANGWEPLVRGTTKKSKPSVSPQGAKPPVEPPKRGQSDIIAQSAVGGALGFEQEKDDQGNVIGYKYDPLKGLLGLTGGVALGMTLGRKGTKKALGVEGEGKPPAEIKSEPKTFDEWINTRRMNLSTEAQAELLKGVQKAKPQYERLYGDKMTNDQVVEAAKTVEAVKGAIDPAITELAAAQVLRARQILTSQSEQIAKTGTASIAQMRQFLRSIETVKSTGTDAGRQLQARKIQAGPETPYFERVLEMLSDGKHDLDAITEAASKIDLNNAKQVTELFRKFEKAKMLDVLREYRFINLLSSPRTHIVNTTSNLLQASTTRPATLLTSGIIDGIASKLTGKARQYYLKDVPAYYRAAFAPQTMKTAATDALEALKGKKEIGKTDIGDYIPTNHPTVKWAYPVLNALEAEDVFVRRIVEAGEKERLTQSFLREGKPLNETAINQEARKNAEHILFRESADPTNKSGQGAMLSAIDAAANAVAGLRNNRYAGPVVIHYLPFLRTINNIVKQMVEHTPAGLGTLPGSEHKVEQLAKVLNGSLVFAALYGLAQSDAITWSPPKGAKEKEAFYNARKIPYSVLIGDQQVKFDKLGVWSAPLALAAAMHYYDQQAPGALSDTQLEKKMQAMTGLFEFMSDQSYTQGVSQLLEAIEGGTTRDPSKLISSLSGPARQYIPLMALNNWVTGIIDPVYRQSSSTIPQKFYDDLMKGIPGLSKNVAPYRDDAGNPSGRPYPVANAFSPVQVGPLNEDKLGKYKQFVREKQLDRLRDQMREAQKTRDLPEMERLAKIREEKAPDMRPVSAPKPPSVPKPKRPISQSDIDSIPAHIQVKYQGIKSKSGEKVQMTGSARQVLKDLYAESELYTKILESLV